MNKLVMYRTNVLHKPNVLVNKYGAYAKIGINQFSLIEGTSRISSKHPNEYWRNAYEEVPKLIEVTSHKNIPVAIYIGRIPLHLGHFIMEGLPKLNLIYAYSFNQNSKFIGYITKGILPSGDITALNTEDVQQIMNIAMDDQDGYNDRFYDCENENYMVEDFYYIPHEKYPYFLSDHVANPSDIAPFIKKIKNYSLEKYSQETIKELYLPRHDDDNFSYDKWPENIFEQIAKVSVAEKLTGRMGSNTHLAIFANKDTICQFEKRGAAHETLRNQLICELVKTYND